jgi:hypothetical protein
VPLSSENGPGFELPELPPEFILIPLEGLYPVS